MRLIDCKTLQLEFFELSGAPDYAILSHTWSNEEVTFQDFQHPQKRQGMQGWVKIKLTCQQALIDQIQYAWVDTCCIDKTSSSELSESINSMFQWYSHSRVCYAFLADYQNSSTNPQKKDITASRWFTRGWTLQELIAPFNMVFFDKDWQHIGTKQDLSLYLSQGAGIEEEILKLDDFEKIRARIDTCTVAQRMSWAASRVTTRVEDLAYCLLGIFGISMPMLYGEGKRAFVRLQEEIIKESNDLTIFAWQTSTEGIANDYEDMKNKHVNKTHRGILAEKPADFAYASLLCHPEEYKPSPEYTMTNKGLKLTNGVSLRILGPDTYFLPLNCHLREDPSRNCGICLRSHGPGIFARLYPERLMKEPETTHIGPDQIYISKHIQARELKALEINHRRVFKLSFKYSPKKFLCKMEAVEPRIQWSTHSGEFMLMPGQSSFTAYHRVSWERNEDDKAKSRKAFTRDEFMVLCGYTKEEGAWVCLASPDNHSEIYLAAESMDLPLAGKLGRESGNMTVGLKQQWPGWAGITMTEEEKIEDGIRLTIFNVQIYLGVENVPANLWYQYGYDKVPIPPMFR